MMERREDVRVRIATIGVLGCGTVGGGVVERLVNASSLDGMPVRLGRVLVRELSLAGRLPEFAPHLTSEAAAVVDDPSVDVVVECLGGLEPALAFVERALRNGKHVVTANKALLAAQGPRLFELSRRQGVALRFEAAVAGAVPIMRVLERSLAAEEVREVAGIINGTTNFVLVAMEEGADFDEALGRARAAGYAEADAGNDILGIDAAQKLSLIAAVAFGAWIPWQNIARRGIEAVSQADFAFARRHGFAVRLLACARRSGAAIAATISPFLVPADHVFARASGVENVVRVIGRGCGTLTLTGAGAGREATASAVVGDVAEVVREIGWPQRTRLVKNAACVALDTKKLDGAAYPVWSDHFGAATARSGRER